MLQEAGMLECMQAYYNLAKSFHDSPSGDTHVAILAQGMQIGTLAHWWPSLVRLRKARKQCSAEDRAHIQSLTDIWRRFGVVLGLDAKREQQRYEDEARTGCSWRNCPRRGQLATGNKPAMRKCAGCGESRYCGRECQTR
ncbi:hypothetical protein PENSPDRAFT_44949 [Peniophora sp. CONT]|nr:hypothetical protein PENSPDRAFT_44949 [Peniophora sp. CONT]